MAELPFFIAGGAKKTPDEQIQGAVRMLEELYQERVGGAYVGDVFEVDAGDVLTLRISDSLEKTGGALAVLPAPLGGIQSTSNGISVKLKSGGGLTADVDGLSVSATAVIAGAGLTKTGETINAIGTADRILINADSIDIASTYAGQTSIVTLGTVTTGTWGANTIAANKGGTGVANNVANAITFTGAYSLGLTLSGNTAVTLPTSGTLATTSQIDTSIYMFGVPLKNAKFVRVFGASLNTGNNDLYTCPASRKAVLLNTSTRCHNASAGNLGHKIAIKSSGTYYPISTWGNLSVGQYTITSPAHTFCMEAGEGLSVITDTNNGYTAGFVVIEFDDDAPIRTVRVNSLANGDNTIYTCPADKTATGISTAWREAVPTIGVSNYSGASRSYVFYTVPTGLAADATTQTYASTAISNVSASNFICSTNLEEGDSIVLNTNDGTAGQFAWITVVELDV